MAVMKTNVLDLSDLGQPTIFKFNGKDYVIPPVSSKKAKELLGLSREIQKGEENRKKKIEEYTSAGKEVPAELLESDSNIFDFQIKFIATAIPGTTLEELEEWPTRLVMRVVTLINESITGKTIDEEEKKA